MSSSLIPYFLEVLVLRVVAAELLLDGGVQLGLHLGVRDGHVQLLGDVLDHGLRDEALHDRVDHLRAVVGGADLGQLLLVGLGRLLAQRDLVVELVVGDVDVADHGHVVTLQRAGGAAATATGGTDSNGRDQGGQQETG